MHITQSELKKLLYYDSNTGVFTNRVDRGTTARAGDVGAGGESFY